MVKHEVQHFTTQVQRRPVPRIIVPYGPFPRSYKCPTNLFQGFLVKYGVQHFITQVQRRQVPRIYNDLRIFCKEL